VKPRWMNEHVIAIEAEAAEQARMRFYTPRRRPEATEPRPAGDAALREALLERLRQLIYDHTAHVLGSTDRNDLAIRLTEDVLNAALAEAAAGPRDEGSAVLRDCICPDSTLGVAVGCPVHDPKTVSWRDASRRLHVTGDDEPYASDATKDSDVVCDLSYLCPHHKGLPYRPPSSRYSQQYCNCNNPENH
jgi:hypothetical protein